MTRPSLIEKTSLAVISIVLGVGCWLGTAALIFKSGISPLQTFALWISHFSFFGWFVGVTLSVIFYQVLHFWLRQATESDRRSK
jgi:hypothetical protein